MTDRNEWRNYTLGQWRQLAHQQADEIERLREFLERGGIDSSAVLAGEDDGTWHDENERLTTRIAELEKIVDLDLDRETRLLILGAANAVIHDEQNYEGGTTYSLMKLEAALKEQT